MGYSKGVHVKHQLGIVCLGLFWSGAVLAGPPCGNGSGRGHGHGGHHGHRNPKGHHVVNVEEDAPSSALTRTTFTVQDGRNSFNQFDVVRLQAGASSAAEPLILLAPFGFPAEFWEVSDDGSYEDAFAPQVALAGYDVWLVDSRLAPAAPGECESGAVDCSPMQDWGMQTAVDDALFVEKLIGWSVPGSKPVVGGLSGGSSTALAAVNQAPNKFSGLFMWEGTLYTDDPAIQARNAAFCQNDRAQLQQGVYYDASVQVFQVLFGLAAAVPNDPTPIPVFPPGTTNLQALLFALSVPDPTNPLNFTDTFVRFVGDPIATTLAFSDLDRILRWGTLVGNYAPVAFIRDSHCAIGGLDNSFTNRLDKFKGKALIFAEGLGFNQMMIDTAGQLSRADVTVDYQPSFGESDRYFNVNWETVGLNPLLLWLNSM